MSESILYGSREDSLIRFALWEVWGQRCAICRVYSLFQNIQTDHLIPESISIDRLAQIREERNLPDDFDVNGLENLVPACSQCNNRKRNDDYSEVLQFDILLRSAKKRKSDVERVVRRFRSNRNIVESVELISRVNLGEESNQELLAPFIESVTEDLYSWGVELSPRLYRSLDANNMAGKYTVWCDVGVWLEGKGLAFFDVMEKVWGDSIENYIIPAVEKISEHFDGEAAKIAVNEMSKDEYFLSGNEHANFSSFSMQIEETDVSTDGDELYILDLSGNVSSTLNVSAAFDLGGSGIQRHDEGSFYTEVKEFDCRADFSVSLEFSASVLGKSSEYQLVEVSEPNLDCVEVVDMS